jgi:hypothetical protein
MKPLRPSLIPLCALVLSACEHKKMPGASDSARATGPLAVDSAIAAARAQHWDPSAGPVLLVMADVPGRAFVLLPDTANTQAAVANIPHPASVTLFGRGGSVQTAELPALSDTGACLAATLSAAPPPHPWNVGFIGGVVSPLAMDSTETLSRADSASAVLAMVGFAAALPNDSAGRFTGLPFVVHSLWRFALPTGQQIVVANLTRQINQEATPLQERTMIISERQPADSLSVAVYSERSSGAEETVESREVLGAVLLGGNRIPALILVRDFGDSTSYSLLERGADGRWVAQWTSPRRHC